MALIGIDTVEESKTFGALFSMKIEGFKFKREFFFSFFFSVLYSSLRHLPLLGFHSVGGCWDRTQNDATLALAVR